MLHERIQEYLREMGMDKALYTAAAAVPFESNRFLERGDLVRSVFFGPGAEVDA